MEKERLAPGARLAAEFFGLDPARAPLCGAFPCSLKGATGHLYIFEFHVGFGAVHLTDVNQWGTPAKLVNNLEISGAAKMTVGLSTGAILTFDDVEDRDAAYDCMVNMLEKIPPSPDEEVHGGDPDHRVPVPLRLGFEPERYVIVHFATTEFLPGGDMKRKAEFLPSRARGAFPSRSPPWAGTAPRFRAAGCGPPACTPRSIARWFSPPPRLTSRQMRWTSR